MMVTFIDAHRGTYGVEPICEVLPVGLATYFRHKTWRAHPGPALGARPARWLAHSADPAGLGRELRRVRRA